MAHELISLRASCAVLCGGAFFVPAAVTAADVITGLDDSACMSGENAVSVVVNGFKNESGQVRVQLYLGRRREFLEKGKWLVRAERPRRSGGPMRFCLPLAHSGNYAIAVRHDANGNGKSDWNDGAGFSRNPDLSLFHLIPKVEDVVFQSDGSTKKLEIVMQYRFGLTVKPVG